MTTRLVIIFSIRVYTNVHDGFLGKKYISKYIKIGKIGVICSHHFTSHLWWPGVPNKDPTVWVHGARTPISMLSPNVHGGFVDIKYDYKYMKISTIGAVLCQQIHCKWNPLGRRIAIWQNSSKF